MEEKGMISHRQDSSVEVSVYFNVLYLEMFLSDNSDMVYEIIFNRMSF